MRLRLRPRGTAPLDVDVAPDPGAAVRRVGRLRLASTLDPADLDALPAARRAAFDDLARWLGPRQASLPMPAVEARAARHWLLPLGMPWTGPWLLLLGLAAVAAGLFRPRPSRGDLVAGLAVSAAALAARLSLGLYAPLHPNGQGPLWIRAATGEPALIAASGPGFAEALGPLARLAGASPDLALFLASAVASGLCPLLLLGIGRRLGLAGPPLLLAPAALAIEPVLVRTAATEAYVPLVAALWLASVLALVESFGRLERARTLRAALLVAGAALLATQAARVHPVSWPLVLLLPAAPLALPLPTTADRRRARRLALAAAAALLSALWATSGTLLADVAADPTVAAAAASVRAGLAAPPRLALALVGACAVAAFVASSRRVLVAVALSAAVAGVLLSPAFDQCDLWQASHERLFWPLPLLAVAGALPRRPGGRGLLWVGLPLLAIVAASLLVHRAALPARTTEQLEHAALRRAFVDLPAGCRLAHVRRVGPRALELPDYVSRARALDVRSAEDLAAATAPGACLYFVRTSLCSSAEARPVCDEVESSRHMEAILREGLPAVPSHRALPYDRDRVDIAVFRVGPPTSG